MLLARQKSKLSNELYVPTGTVIIQSILVTISLDEALYPQFDSSSTTPGTATVRSSARTYFYQDEHKCDENMEHFITCINAAGIKYKIT